MSVCKIVADDGSLFSKSLDMNKYAFSGICKNTCNFSKDYLS